ncbi:DUF3011 domain-containing protein [Pseudoxanthomonas winnipegensis]|uniref:DUF3011 domain-containing protein n=1 Tax=Pseudoxanthomonas winnipegensis TaxID=2480810 RepID=A0A4Q8LR41_9GAMM|nr:DUF3011 domain-containing protein [Pseudoxanthomonas winnipegensis]RZZ89179.1 DUF3011 domain-containing protein [Pseudoxanthomonas winnipegensis]TAA33371.1 DUF3011 domain-containing protein [Pseudoxanthomonas winnipegensis]TBV75942.1 DUF3011 domain-containing protein [Pseudoxanthomonas winnipegensis]
MLRLFAVLLFALGVYAAAPAHAQDSVTCESQNNRYRECRGFGGRVRLDRALSDSPCIEGRTWGTRGDVIWVDRGCRGRFVSVRGGGWGDRPGAGRTVRCESADNRTRECATGFRGRAVLVRQLSDSRCVEGRSWGQRGGNIWVSQGCRGEFAEGRGGGWGGGPPGEPGWGNANPNYTVTCSSSDNRRTSCGWDRRNGRPVIVKQLSSSPCIEGSTWAWRGDQIWVDEGCRARFGAR